MIKYMHYIDANTMSEFIISICPFHSHPDASLAFLAAFGEIYLSQELPWRTLIVAMLFISAEILPCSTAKKSLIGKIYR